MSATSLTSFLDSHQLDDAQIDWDDVSTAIEACNEDGGGIEHRTLFSIERFPASPFSGDDDDFAGMFVDKESGEAAVYLASNASGMGVMQRLDSVDGKLIGDFVAGYLEDCEWGPLQFYGTTIYNQAPDLISKDFFTFLLEEAGKRHPDHVGQDEPSDPKEWVEKNYSVS